MSSRTTGDAGVRFVIYGALLLLLIAAAGTLFWLPKPTQAIVPAAEVAIPKDTPHQSQKLQADRGGNEIFKTIRRRPDFSVADRQDATDQLRENETNIAVAKARDLIDDRRYSEAIDILRVAVEKHPDYFTGWMELGIAHLFQDFDLEAAKSAFQKAVELQPNNRNSLDAMKNVYIELNDLEGCINFLEQLSDRYPDAKQIDLVIGQLTYRIEQRSRQDRSIF